MRYRLKLLWQIIAFFNIIESNLKNKVYYRQWAVIAVNQDQKVVLKHHVGYVPLLK